MPDNETMAEDTHGKEATYGVQKSDFQTQLDALLATASPEDLQYAKMCIDEKSATGEEMPEEVEFSDEEMPS